ncbi:MAG: hypothetical protein AAGC68_04305 [Verrucomicrobiota bacterium]
MPDTFKILDQGDGNDQSLERLISQLGVTPGVRGTFSPIDLNLEASWETWIGSLFTPTLAEAFVRAHHEGLLFRAAEIIQSDRELDLRLDEKTKRSSVAAARAFLDGKEEMQSNQVWLRFSDAVANGETPGHLPVVFSHPSPGYHRPHASALEANGWVEFRSRAGEANPTLPSEPEKEIFRLILPHLPVALQQFHGDSSRPPYLPDEDPPDHLQVV